ncbi:MAG: prepilin-type N-terminal cleavage/methylation domain-containing protein [Candidatus Omnitrophica bacterium]|nr:prepilin-type N-terminal cleavage/methylation domain-containing protein [Candidatus Omnitrophota bacterium]
MKMSRGGMTLTEVLIVIVILGILAGLVLPRYLGQEERGIVAEAVGMLSAIRQAEVAYHLEHSAYTANLADLDLDLTQIKFTYTVDAGTGTATATRTGGGTDFDGTTLILNIDGTWDPAATHPFKPK